MFSSERPTSSSFCLLTDRTGRVNLPLTLELKYKIKNIINQRTAFSTYQSIPLCGDDELRMSMWTNKVQWETQDVLKCQQGQTLFHWAPPGRTWPGALVDIFLMHEPQEWSHSEWPQTKKWHKRTGDLYTVFPFLAAIISGAELCTPWDQALGYFFTINHI